MQTLMLFDDPDHLRWNPEWVGEVLDLMRRVGAMNNNA